MSHIFIINTYQKPTVCQSLPLRCITRECMSQLVVLKIKDYAVHLDSIDKGVKLTDMCLQSNPSGFNHDMDVIHHVTSRGNY